MPAPFPSVQNTSDMQEVHKHEEKRSNGTRGLGASERSTSDTERQLIAWLSKALPTFPVYAREEPGQSCCPQSKHREIENVEGAHTAWCALPEASLNLSPWQASPLAALLHLAPGFVMSTIAGYRKSALFLFKSSTIIFTVTITFW